MNKNFYIPLPVQKYVNNKSRRLGPLYDLHLRIVYSIFRMKKSILYIYM